MGSDFNKKIRDYYDRTSFEYQLVLGLNAHHGMHFGYYENPRQTYTEANLNLNRVLAEYAEIKSGERVLDAGCGIGGSSVWLAKNRQVETVGITLSQKQRDQAEKFAQSVGVSVKTEFLVRDFLRTGFAENCFDVVWAIESVCHANKKFDFLHEAYRVLRPGGRLIVADGFANKVNLNATERKLMNSWLKGWWVPNLATVTGFTSDMKKIGFKKIRFWDVSEKVMPFSKWISNRAGWLLIPAKFLRLLGVFDNVNINNGIAAVNQYPALSQDLWAYGIFLGKKD